MIFSLGLKNHEQHCFREIERKNEINWWTSVFSKTRTTNRKHHKYFKIFNAVCLNSLCILDENFALQFWNSFCVSNYPKLPKNYPSRDQMVILQDSARILQKLLSCKICQKNGYLARSARKMAILQDSCKFVPVELSSYWLPFMQHISFWPEIYLRISCLFFKKKT